MPSEAENLSRVKRAADARRRAEDAYRAALVAAVSDLEAAGHRAPYAAVARAASVTRQTVRELVEKARAEL